MNQTDRPAFSLIELLIVLTLLGILAATTIPPFLAAGADARQTALLDDLRMFRQQIEQFRSDHGGRLPAQDTNSGAAFVAQLTQRTRASGEVDARGPLGPYLLGDPPANPYTRRSGILVVPGPLREDHVDGRSGHGWAFSSTTGEFRASAAPSITDRVGRAVNRL